ncbi:unnamed protein product [Candidula unifasciata]|uniref:Uncharacterized protein n=1 Tax=Candidula unifasciata TaxID=100452 RepID=A0A8S3ZN53_9EUPU|nr:unnamed protein product [Candidula unifasciata]
MYICVILFGETEMKSLLETLFEGYNPLVRPSRTIDTKQQILFLRGFLKIIWRDELLQWDPAKNGGIERIVIPQNRVWKPDLVIHNTANGNDKLGSDAIFVAVRSYGRVTWYPPLYLESTCKLDMSKYPFDVSVCPVDIWSWSHDNTSVFFQKCDSPIKLETMLVNGEYEISSAGSVKITDKYDKLFYDKIMFNIRLARRPAYVAISLLIPVNLLAILSIMSFIMPPDEQEKVNISVTILLSFTVFLTFIDNSIPPNSDNVSLLGDIFIISDFFFFLFYIPLLLRFCFPSVVGNSFSFSKKIGMDTRKTARSCVAMSRTQASLPRQSSFVVAQALSTSLEETTMIRFNPKVVRNENLSQKIVKVLIQVSAVLH